MIYPDNRGAFQRLEALGTEADRLGIGILGNDGQRSTTSEFLNLIAHRIASLEKSLDEASLRWIPVSERLPDYMDTVLTYVSQAGTPLVYCGYYDDGRDAGLANDFSPEEMRGWWGHTSCSGSKKLEGAFEPTHWMPLPEVR